MGRSPCCDENGLKKGPWTPEEDQKLVHYIHSHGHGSWRALPKLAGLKRCGKSCRLRWTNYLRPDIKRGKFSPDEEQTILNLHSILGNKWSAIATHLPGRTDNEIKNFWNTHLKKKLIQMGFDPMTHRPRTDFYAALPHLLALANLVDRRPSTWPLVDGLSADKLLQCLDQYILQYSAKAAVNTNHLMQPIAYAAPISTTCVDLSSTVNPLMPFAGSTALFEPPDQMENIPNLIGYDDEDQPAANLMDIDNNISCFSLFAASTDDHQPGEISSNNNIPDHYFLASSQISTLPPLIHASSNPAADGCSSSSCRGTSCSGAASFWPDVLLDDPFMADFA